MGKRATKKTAPPKAVKKEPSEKDSQAVTSGVLSLMNFRAYKCVDPELQNDAMQALEAYKQLSPEMKKQFVADVAACPRNSKSKLKLAVVMQKYVVEECALKKAMNTNWLTVGGVLSANGYSMRDFETQDAAIGIAMKFVDENQKMHGNQGQKVDNGCPLTSKYLYINDLGSTASEVTKVGEMIQKSTSDLKTMQAVASNHSDGPSEKPEQSATQEAWDSLQASRAKVEGKMTALHKSHQAGVMLGMKLAQNEEPQH